MTAEGMTIRFNGVGYLFVLDLERRRNTRRTYRKLRRIWNETRETAHVVTALSVFDAMHGGVA